MTGFLTGMVHTVLGPVAPKELGVTLPHEHILSTLEVYLEEPHSPVVAESTVEELAQLLIAELSADATSGGFPCGVLGEIGLSSPMTAAERKVLRAVAIAQRETGAPVSIHTQAPGAQGIQALDVLEAGGVELQRVAIAHVDTVMDHAYHAALAARGAFVEYDFFGWGEVAATAEYFVHSDRERVAGVAKLLAAGYRDRVLLSQDVVTRMQLAEYGGSGYARLARDLPPLFAEYGIAGDELRRLMTENPAR